MIDEIVSMCNAIHVNTGLEVRIIVMGDLLHYMFQNEVMRKFPQLMISGYQPEFEFRGIKIRKDESGLLGTLKFYTLEVTRGNL